jgi:hypothetical protein
VNYVPTVETVRARMQGPDAPPLFAADEMRVVLEALAESRRLSGGIIAAMLDNGAPDFRATDPAAYVRDLKTRAEQLWRALDLYGRHKYQCQLRLDAGMEQGAAGTECICGLAHALNAPASWTPPT